MSSVTFQDNKITIQKSVVFLYTNNKLSEWEIRKQAVYNCIKKKKALGINLTQGSKKATFRKL